MQLPDYFSKDTLWAILKILLAVILIGLVFAQTSVDDFRRVLKNISIPFLFASLAIFLILTWLSARRYWILLGKQIPFHRLFNLRIIQNVVTNFVASSAGAATYIGILRGDHGVKLTLGFASFLLAIVGDLFAIGLVLTLSLFVVWSQIEPLHWLVVILLASIFFGLFLFVLTILLRQQFVNAIKWLFKKISIDRYDLPKKGLEVLSNLADLDPRKLSPFLFPVMSYSLILLLIKIPWMYVNVHAFGLPLEVLPIIFIVPIMNLISLLPIQVFGGLGTTDISQLYLFQTFTPSGTDVASVIVGIRILFYLLNLILLLYIPVGTYITRKNAKDITKV